MNPEEPKSQSTQSQQPHWQQNAPQGYQPVAPLHGTSQQSQQPQHQTVVGDPVAEAKYNESKIRYPEINLSPGEYVIDFVRRHPIGLLSIWVLTGFLTIVLLAMAPVYAANREGLSDMLGFSLPDASLLVIPIMILVALILLGGFIATIVYQGNRFYLTNESVIQHVKTSLFDDKNQIINLVNVEDVSFDKKGILQQVLDYGTLRLSTQGEETIYHFYYVSKPQRVVNEVNDAVELAMRKLEGDLRMHQIRE